MDCDKKNYLVNETIDSNCISQLKICGQISKKELVPTDLLQALIKQRIKFVESFLQLNSWSHLRFLPANAKCWDCFMVMVIKLTF